VSSSLVLSSSPLAARYEEQPATAPHDHHNTNHIHVPVALNLNGDQQGPVDLVKHESMPIDLDDSIVSSLVMSSSIGSSCTWGLSPISKTKTMPMTNSSRAAAAAVSLLALAPPC
jgi:hypothetical protein